jgi:sulfur relay (sulfurtransferase) DsrC/TusE family protein|tara:strand:+ start:715 stop:867 length:153 start_codon:yes stop_codon:yes gene_type:complete
MNKNEKGDLVFEKWKKNLSKELAKRFGQEYVDEHIKIINFSETGTGEKNG